VRYAGHLSPEEFWERDAAMEQRVRETSTVLPCYGLVGWSGLRMIGDWEWENDRLVTVGLAHGAPEGTGPRLHVKTTVGDPAAVVALLRASAPEARTEGSIARWRRELEAEPDDSVTIEVDSAGVQVDVWHSEGRDRWWAAGHHGGHGLVLEAHLMSAGDVRLHRVHDLEPYLDGRRAYLRQVRGGI